NHCTCTPPNICSADTTERMSFPTRRSSDLLERRDAGPAALASLELDEKALAVFRQIEQMIELGRGAPAEDPALARGQGRVARARSEEHTSELQSLAYLVCRLLLEKKNTFMH